MIQVYCYDEQGLFTQSKFVKELGKNMTTKTWQGLYRPRWNGTEWVEDMPQAEIDVLNNQPQEPTAEERLQSLEDAMVFLTLGGM